VANAPCEAEACKGQSAPVPDLGSPGTSGFSGPPTTHMPRKPGCPKGKHRVHRRGSSRCVKNHHKRHHRSTKTTRRTSR
jgi:hypothetical protein